MPVTPTQNCISVLQAVKQSPMEAWWREDYEFPIRFGSTPKTLTKSDFLTTSSSSKGYQASVLTTASAPTPQYSTWADTPSRKAFSTDASPPTGSGAFRDSTIPSEWPERHVRPVKVHSEPVADIAKVVECSNIDRPTKNFVNAALKYRLAKGDTPASLESNFWAVLTSLGDDTSLNSIVVMGLFCSEMTALTSNNSYDTNKLRAAIQKLPYKLRADRYHQKLTDENAQGVFPPDACLFVGNLHKEEADPKLRSLIFAVMSQYGECNVRMTRDVHSVPTAFVQFWDIESATEAVQNAARVRAISGRLPRIEQARVQRELYVCNEDRSPVSVVQVNTLMEDQGPYANITYPSIKAVKSRGLPAAGVIIEFCTFGDYNDTHKSNFNSAKGIFAFPWPEEAIRKPKPDDIKSCATSNSSLGPESKPASVVGSFDARSVFVGNLHRNVTHFELKTLFSEAGIVLNVHMAKHPSKKGNLATYAFIEFTHPTAVWVAVMMRDGHIHRGFPMRVQMRKNVFSGNYAAAQTLFQNAPNAFGQPSATAYIASGNSSFTSLDSLSQSSSVFSQPMPSAWCLRPAA